MTPGRATQITQLPYYVYRRLNLNVKAWSNNTKSDVLKVALAYSYSHLVKKGLLTWNIFREFIGFGVFFSIFNFATFAARAALQQNGVLYHFFADISFLTIFTMKTFISKIRLEKIFYNLCFYNYFLKINSFGVWINDLQ